MNELIMLINWSDPEVLCSFIVLIVGLIGAIVALVPTLIKLCKSLATIVKNKNWDKIKEIADAAMKAAEASGKSGAEKQEMVIAAVKAGCAEAEIELDEEILNNLIKYIQECIAWFNDMNKKTKKAKKIKGE